MEIPGNLNRCEVLGLVNCTSSALWDQQCIRYANPVQQLCYIWRFSTATLQQKRNTGIYGHTWQIANGSIHMVPHGSGNISFFHTNITCTEFSCSSALNNDYKNPLRGTWLTVIQKFVGYFKYSSSTATRQYKQQSEPSLAADQLSRDHLKHKVQFLSMPAGK